MHPALESLALPSLDEALPERFRRALGLAPAGQYGVAVRELGEAIAGAETRRAGPFVRARVSPPRWREHGERRRATLEFALGYCDDAQLEFLGPGVGTGFYVDVLGERRAALHHVGIYQHGLAAAAHRLAGAGFPMVVSGGLDLGPLARFTFAYFDTRAALGHYLEILDFAWLGERPVPLRPLIERAARLRARASVSRPD
ncbi:MAG: VOC family protein [Deltaproteobacteria bacterium]|nr:VOC family protein [Deltaproteobacteria bacterium]